MAVYRVRPHTPHRDGQCTVLTHNDKSPSSGIDLYPMYVWRVPNSQNSMLSSCFGDMPNSHNRTPLSCVGDVPNSHNSMPPTCFEICLIHRTVCHHPLFGMCLTHRTVYHHVVFGVCLNHTTVCMSSFSAARFFVFPTWTATLSIIL